MDNALEQIQRLLDVMRALRDPQTGCPWDIEQTNASIRKYVIEEAYEVADAIDGGDDPELTSELGDLLLQVVFHAQIAQDENRFNFADIAASIADKMIARHPHVFGEAGPRTEAEQRVDWERIKQGERKNDGKARTLDGVANALPALLRAYKLQKRAARVGFDWGDLAPVRAKVYEELDELKSATKEEQLGELGDALFALVNYGRHLGLDPEEALAMTNTKFTDRFSYVEDRLADDNKTPDQATLNEMERHWQDAKNK